MAKLFGINSKMSGRIGDFVYVQSKRHGTLVYEAVPNTGDPRRSYKQMSTRTQWANLGATYKMFDDMLKHGFEEVPANMTSYNAFVQANLGVVKVYITKRMRRNGGCVLAPYTITEGSLSRVLVGLNGSGILVSSLSLGSLVINAQTTLAQFSEAVIANNLGWEEGDQLTFFHGVQTIDAGTGVPRATLVSHKMMLDTANPAPLWSVVSAQGFSSVDGCLGMSQVLTDGAAAWVHSRESQDGKLRVSTQHFYVENAALATFQTLSALTAATDSYGGINTAKVYLKPDEETNAPMGSGSQSSSSGSSGSSGSGTGSGSQSGSSGSSSGGSSETPTVAAPTISGTTPFEESTTVTMSGPAGATIHYTTDGSTPTSASTAYSEAITLTDTTTVKAVAVKDGVSSSVTSRTFTKGTGNGSEGPEGE